MRARPRHLAPKRARSSAGNDLTHQQFAGAQDLRFRPPKCPDLGFVIAADATGAMANGRNVVFEFAELPETAVDVAGLGGETQIVWIAPRHVHVFTGGIHRETADDEAPFVRA